MYHSGDIKVKILFLDDQPSRHDKVDADLGWDKVEVVHVWTVDECIEALQTKGPFDRIYLDHDLNHYGHKTGKWSMIAGTYGDQELTGADVCSWMARNMQERPRVIVHSWNHSGANRMVSILRDAGFSVVWELFNGGSNQFDDDYLDVPGIKIED